MGLAEFVKSMQGLLEKAKKNQLSDVDHSEWDAGRNQLATAMLSAQKLQVPEGGKPRDYLRAPKMVAVDLQVPGGRFNVATVEIWPRGFAALLAEGLPLHQAYKCQIKLRPGVLVECEATPYDAKRQASNFKVFFAIDGVSDSDVELISVAVFEEVLSKLVAARR